MAKGKKTGGRDFKPGQSGNPSGRPTVPQDLRAARSMNQVELERILNKYMYLSLAEIKQEVNKPDTPAVEVIVGKIVAEAISRGDPGRLDFILNRTVGAVKKTVEIVEPVADRLKKARERAKQRS